MKLGLFFVLVGIATVALAAPGDSNFDTDIRFNLKKLDIFGRFDQVFEWVREARSYIRDSFARLLRDPNRKLKDTISKDQEIPFDGYVFRLPEKFEDMTINDIRTQLLGFIPTNKDNEVRDEQLEMELIQEMSGVTEETLPESYNFYDSYPDCKAPPIDQGSCGSCWAFSASTAVSGRICKAVVDKHRSEPEAGWKIPANKFRVSPQQFVSCKPGYDPKVGNATATDGCKGGNLTPPLKYVADGNEISEFTCLGYHEDRRHDLCGKVSSCETKWKISGKVTSLTTYPVANRVRELKIMKDLVDHGPIPIGFKVPATFMGFSGVGVFRRNPSDAWLGTGEMHSWHAMTIVGYGKEDNVPYWLMENSWGPIYCEMDRGNQHLVKMIRGQSVFDEETTMFAESNEVPSIVITLDRKPVRTTENINFPVLDRRCFLSELGESCQSYDGRKLSYGFCKASCSAANDITNSPRMIKECRRSHKCCKVNITPNRCSNQDFTARCDTPAVCTARNGQRYRNLCGAGPKICCSGAITAADANLATDSETVEHHAEEHNSVVEEEDDEAEEEFPENH